MVVHFMYALVRGTWYGMAWYAMVLHSIERYSVVLHGNNTWYYCTVDLLTSIASIHWYSMFFSGIIFSTTIAGSFTIGDCE